MALHTVLTLLIVACTSTYARSFCPFVYASWSVVSLFSSLWSVSNRRIQSIGTGINTHQLYDWERGRRILDPYIQLSGGTVQLTACGGSPPLG